ncbi:MAG: hypothetical protein C0444_06425 [Microbacterium sp.]|nr:hypothetical protein [Microbacterium sp.]MBA4345125.1 hypothetical protein [Microbacterium sp.]
MDPLAPFDRQDPCWCGSGKAYRLCHERFASPRHQPGAPVSPDDDEFISLSPDVRLARAAIPSMMPAGTPLSLPPKGPTPRPLSASAFDRAVASSTPDEESATAPELGRARLALLRELAALPDSERPLNDNVAAAVAVFAVDAWKTSAALRQSTPRRTIIWNEELPVNQLIGRTLLLADHVLYPDRLVDALRSEPTARRLRALALEELEYEHLIGAGHVIPVPDGVAQYIGGDSIQKAAKRALANESLVQFVRSQLVVEGPSAREVLFINAIDDFDTVQHMWFYGHFDPSSGAVDDRRVGFRMLQPYDPAHDYSAWIRQETDRALATYLQRTEQRLVVADVLGAEYVAASPFEARVLQRRGLHEPSLVNATLWAGVPELSNLGAKDLARMLSAEEAVEDLRARVRIAMEAAPDFPTQISSIRAVAADIEQASRVLERRMRTSRALGFAAPAVAGGLGLMVGSAGGVAGIAAGALGLLGSISPAIGERLNQRREAAFLFTMPKRKRP